MDTLKKLMVLEIIKYFMLVPTNESEEKINKCMKNCGLKSEI